MRIPVRLSISGPSTTPLLSEDHGAEQEMSVLRTSEPPQTVSEQVKSLEGLTHSRCDVVRRHKLLVSTVVLVVLGLGVAAFMVQRHFGNSVERDNSSAKSLFEAR